MLGNQILQVLQITLLALQTQSPIPPQIEEQTVKDYPTLFVKSNAVTTTIPSTPPYTPSGLELKFYKSEDMLCGEVVVEDGATPLDCDKFIRAWNQAKDIYEQRVGRVKGVQAAQVKFVKRRPDGFDKQGNPVFIPDVGELDTRHKGEKVYLFYGLFDPNSVKITFTVEASVFWEGLHAIDYILHPYKERPKRLQNQLSELGSSQKWRWTIIGHGTEDDPIVEH